MKTHLHVFGVAGHRRVVMAALVVLLIVAGLAGFQKPAQSMEALSLPDAAIAGAQARTLPVIAVPQPEPVQAADGCLPLLHTARHFSTPALPPSVSTLADRDRQQAGKAAALGLVFGVRFALGPREIARPGKSGKAVTLDVWQPRSGNDLKAMAVADYRRCKNEQALKALSDWRWAR